MSQSEELAHFYQERVPDQFNRSVASQRAAAESGSDDAVQLLEAMCAARGTIHVRVWDESEDLCHQLRVQDGEMVAGEGAGPAPFMTIGHSIEGFSHLEHQCGDSILGFLGAMAGQGSDMKLTAQRVQTLRDLDASVVIELKGTQGFELFVHFGVGSPEPEPRAAIRFDPETFEALQRGSLDPQEAFLNGRVEVEGDLEVAIRLALAAMSPD